MQTLGRIRWFIRILHPIRVLLLVLLIGCLCLGGEAAIAADMPANLSTSSDQQTSLPPSTNLQADDISTEKVSQFVRAYLQVVELLNRREGDLQSAETQLESIRLQQEIEMEAFHTIEAAGLTLQEYLQLLGLANTDPEFGERVATQLQEVPLQ